MFKWFKKHGCNCTPLPKNGEKYILSIGDLYGGTIIYDPNRLGWEASYEVCGRKVSGMAGGGMTKEEAMEFVEDRIIKSLGEIRSLFDDTHREIYDALWQKDQKTGEFHQERLG